MKILWVCPLFLHPTTKGGQIRTLGLLRELNRQHEIHFVALDSTGNPEGIKRSSEYCAQSYAIKHPVPSQTSPLFLAQLIAGLFSPIPLAVSRFESQDMRRQIELLLREHRFDHIICDFLAAAPNIPDLRECILFQHNVETTIWERRASNAFSPFHKALYSSQARRMFAYERRVCEQVRHVIAVSEEDALRMRTLFDISHVSSTPTGVDVDYFVPPRNNSAGSYDLVFIGSMDWAPNIDGMLYFLAEIFPLIRARHPGCRLAIVGRTPGKAILEAAERDPSITVTGTVPDVRPYLWGAKAAIVPLRIGGGTRLKIYEAMAAKVPVVSTTIGAEGLPVVPEHHIFIADDPAKFAEYCIDLLSNAGLRERISQQAWEFVTANFSWAHVARRFEDILVNSVAGVA